MRRKEYEICERCGRIYDAMRETCICVEEKIDEVEDGDSKIIVLG